MKNKESSNIEYRQLIYKYTKNLDVLNNIQGSDVIRWLSKEIYDGKQSLKYNSVDFIIGKFLTKNDDLINFQKRDNVNLYIIGTFTNDFIPVTKVAKALATFYLEMKVMPNLITISKKQFLSDATAATSKINQSGKWYHWLIGCKYVICRRRKSSILLQVFI